MKEFMIFYSFALLSIAIASIAVVMTWFGLFSNIKQRWCSYRGQRRATMARRAFEASVIAIDRENENA